MGKEEGQDKRLPCPGHSSQRRGSTARKTVLHCQICCSNPALGRQLREKFTAPRVDVSRAGGSRQIRLWLVLVGDGEAALGIKMHPYYTFACTYICMETCGRAENVPRWTCTLFFPYGLYLPPVVQRQSMTQCVDCQSVWERCSCLKKFYVQGLVFSSDCYNTSAFQGQGLLTFAICCMAMNSATSRK